MKTPRQYSIIKYSDEFLEATNLHKEFGEKRFVYLGEIPNMTDHCVIVNISTGAVMTGYHIGNFDEVHPDDC